MTHEKPSYSSGSLRIEAVKPEDFPVFREMLGELVDLLDMRNVYTLPDDELHHALFDEPPRMEAIIARYQGEPAGFATWTEAFHLVTGKIVMSFDYIYARPEYRTRLITPALLIYLLFIAERRGYIRVEGAVHEWNTETSKFYESLNAVAVPQKIYRFNMADFDWSPFRHLLEVQPESLSETSP